MKILSALLLTLALAFVAEGSGCRIVTVRGHHSYAAPVVVHHGVDYHAAHVDRHYSIGYNPAGEALEAIKLLIEDNKAMREQLIQAIKAGPSVSPGAGPGPLMPLKAEPLTLKHPPEQASCVSCHDSTNAKANGDGITFYKDGILIDSDENLEAMIRAVTEKKTMPRGPKWDDGQRLAWMRSMVLRPETAKK